LTQSGDICARVIRGIWHAVPARFLTIDCDQFLRLKAVALCDGQDHTNKRKAYQ